MRIRQTKIGVSELRTIGRRLIGIERISFHRTALLITTRNVLNSDSANTKFSLKRHNSDHSIRYALTELHLIMTRFISIFIATYFALGGNYQATIILCKNSLELNMAQE